MIKIDSELVKGFFDYVQRRYPLEIVRETLEKEVTFTNYLWYLHDIIESKKKPSR